MRSALPALMVLLACACASACDSDSGGESATETNVSRVPCRTDSDCGGDLHCEPFDSGAPTEDGGFTGLCEVRL